MAFVIWYRVELSGAGGGPKVTVSNDVFGGDWLCDADISLTTLDGAGGGSLGITLSNLPAAVGKQLSDRHEAAPDGQPLVATAFLGYFDDVPLISRPAAVMTGAVTGVKTKVGDDGALTTTLEGQEMATWRLLRRKNVSRPYQSPVTPTQAMTDVLGDAGVQSEGSFSRASLGSLTVQAPDALQAVDQIARLAGEPVVLRDGKVVFGAAATSAKGPDISDNTNAVSIDSALFATPKPRARDDGVNHDRQATASPVYEITTLGDNHLRAGQQVTVKVTGEQPKDLRIQRLVHRFSSIGTGGGYTCEMRLVTTSATSPPEFAGAHGVVRRIRDITGAAATGKPYVDVGQVTEYETGADGKHLVTLDYGQSPGPDIVEPSVEAPIGSESHLHHKPIASPFAFDKCGLMVPAYPGQRALLAHSGGDPNDAAVAGYLWSEDPAYARPKNQSGDWWLCLPTELDGNGRPTGKGANDLIDSAGLRTIQAKGLQVAVGHDKLADVGERPSSATADSFQIDHKSGTTVTIDSDGKVSVTTSSKDIELTNGMVTLKLSGTTVDVS